MADVTNWPSWALAVVLTSGIVTFVAFLVASAQDGVNGFGVIATASVGFLAALATQELRRRRASGG